MATGGPGLVKSAYSAGKPALGVGAGNVPAFIERTADVKKAVRDIVISKTFDNGMICASEQAIVADAPVKDQVIAELKANNCYIMNDDESAKVAKTHHDSFQRHGRRLRWKNRRISCGTRWNLCS